MNKPFMIGERSNGHCRRSCGVCEPCGGGDAVCQARNRGRNGFLAEDIDAELSRLFPPTPPDPAAHVR